jgi:hypothetical protein
MRSGIRDELNLALNNSSNRSALCLSKLRVVGALQDRLLRLVFPASTRCLEAALRRIACA